MKLANTVNIEVSGDDFEGKDASIAPKNIGKMFAVVSKLMYSRPIESIVREITSNCFDSHIEAKIDDPVVVSFGEDEAGEFILFKDVGVGMSPERMDVYSEWFSSTKEDTDEQLGMWGLGSKSPLAYTSQFFLTTVFNGKKYEYCVHEGVKKPRVDLLIEEGTEERNGTEVKIYIKNERDRASFIAACKSELVYFDNVYLDGGDFYSFDNEYTILEYSTFNYRDSNSYSKQLHCILGKVAYPINWEELGISPINIPVGLRFKIGELQITPEREKLRYVDVEVEKGVFKSTKQIILDRIKEFKDEITTLYNKELVTEFEDYEEYLAYNRNTFASIKLQNGQELNVSSIVTRKEAKFLPLSEYIGKIPENPFYAYKTIWEYNHQRKSREYNRILSYNRLRENLHVFPSKIGKYTTKKQAFMFEYARDITNDSTFYTFKKHERGTNYTKREWIKEQLHYLGIPIKSKKYDYSKTNALKQYKLFNDWVESELSRFVFDYDDIEIPQPWLKKYAEEHSRKYNIKEGSFIVYNYGRATIGEKEYVTLEELDKFTGFILYGFEANEELLRNFRILLSCSKYGTKNQYLDWINSKQCRIYKTAQKNEKHFVSLSRRNAIHVEDFMGNNKIFKRFATAALIEQESKAIGISGASSSRDAIHFQTAMKDYIFPPVGEALRDINDACRDFGKAAYTRADNKITDTFFDELVSVAKEHNLYDKEMYDVHLKLEAYVKGLQLINHILLTDKSIPHVVEYLGLKGKPVAAIFTAPLDYEKQLVQESLEKAEYLSEVYGDRECKTTSDTYQTASSYTRYKYPTDLTTLVKNTLISRANEGKQLFNTINKYYEIIQN